MLQCSETGLAELPVPLIPALEIEKFVVDQIRRIGQSPGLVAATVEQVQQQSRSQLAALEAEQASLDRELTRWGREIADVVSHVGPRDETSPAVARLADLQERTRLAERRATEVREQIHAIKRRTIGEHEIAEAMAKFDPLWEALTPREQTRVVELLVERVDYDGKRGKVAVTFSPEGVRSFGDELMRNEVAA